MKEQVIVGLYILVGISFDFLEFIMPGTRERKQAMLPSFAEDSKKLKIKAFWPAVLDFPQGEAIPEWSHC